MSSLINLYVLKECNTKASTRWRVSDDNLILKDLIKHGLRDRLHLNMNPQFKFFEIDHDGSKAELGSENDLIQLGYKYEIIDARLIEAEYALPSTSSTPSLPSTPAFSNDFNDEDAASLAPLRDGNSTPQRPAKVQRLASAPAAKTPSKKDHIAFFFHRNRAQILQKYDEYKPGAPLMVKTENLYDFINDREIAKAAIYMLRENVEPDLHESAVFVVLGVVMDLIAVVTPSFAFPRSDRESLATMLNSLSASTHFKHITTSNGGGNLDERIKKRRKSLSGKAPRMNFGNQDVSVEAEINKMSTAMNEEPDDTKVAKLFENSGDLLFKWVQILLKMKEHERGMVSQFLAKFPQVKGNVQLIHQAYQKFVATRKSTIFDLSKKFRELIPAIYEMSFQPATEALSLRETEIRAGQLLADLIMEKAHGKNSDYGRLVVDCTTSSDVRNALKQKKDSGITAPAILAVGTYPEVTFWIAVDDVPLKVPGTFADALQSFMEVTWLFNLKYDEKVKCFVRFFESLMGYAKAASTSRMQLLQKLMKLKDTIEHRANETSSTSQQEPSRASSNDRDQNGDAHQ